jgi:hypothetical protein
MRLPPFTPPPPGKFLVLIFSVRGWVEPRAIVRLEGLGGFQNSVSKRVTVAPPMPERYETCYLYLQCFHTRHFYERNKNLLLNVL